MIFRSITEFESYVKSKMPGAVQMAREKCFQIIDRFVKEYYAEYSPVMYERTYQLYRSLVKSEVRATSNGYECEIYFDASNLDYKIKTFNGVTYPNPRGDAGATLNSAAHGKHGGKASGTAIWDEPIAILSTEAVEILKSMLIASGIPIR